MSLPQRKSVMKAFICSQFNYCPLVCMCHNRKLNTRINHIHERALRIVYRDYNSTFEELLCKDETFTIHERNIQLLGIELFKVVNGLSPDIMHDVFPLKQSVRYPTENIFETRNIHTVRYGTDSLSHLGPKIWSIIPNKIKEESTLISFTRKIKKWKPTLCPCRICKIYIDKVGYID